jgi:hypothetical protein
VTLRFYLGDNSLSFRIEFEVGNQYTGEQYFAVDPTYSYYWRRTDAGKQIDYGVFEDGKLVSHVGGERIVHESAADFRAWFPRYVRDDVMSFVIAELAR